MSTYLLELAFLESLNVLGGKSIFIQVFFVFYLLQKFCVKLNNRKLTDHSRLLWHGLTNSNTPLLIIIILML